MVAAVVKHLDGIQAEETAQKTAKLAEEKSALAKNRDNIARKIAEGVNRANKKNG